MRRGLTRDPPSPLHGDHRAGPAAAPLLFEVKSRRRSADGRSELLLSPGTDGKLSCGRNGVEAAGQPAAFSLLERDEVRILSTARPHNPVSTAES